MQEILAFLAPTLTLVAVQMVGLTIGLLVEWVGQREQSARGFEWVRRSSERLRKALNNLWRWAWHKDRRPSVIIYTSAAALAALGFASFGSQNAILADLAPEMVSTAVAISLVDWLFNYRSEQREKKRVISQMGSTDSKSVALAALAVLRSEGWLMDGTLKGADFWGAKLENADMNEAVLAAASLASANLRGSHLIAADLKYTDFLGANLSDAALAGADFEGALLLKANLMNADLTEANLAHVLLIGANLENASLPDTNFEGARFDATTVWPEGFDPKSAGAIFVPYAPGFLDLELANWIARRDKHASK